MDWAAVFDEAYPEPGASAEALERFVAGVARPLSADEVRAATAAQRNPFPPHDPHHAVWRPLDPARWAIPDRPLPASYLSFLRWSDGGWFRSGDREFGFFPTLDPTGGVRAMMLAYEVPQYMPGAVPVAFNGGGTFYLLDLRRPAAGGEYPVVAAHAGHLGWGPDACRPVADTFLAACRGTANVDDLGR
jgi:hypothetical protein